MILPDRKIQWCNSCFPNLSGLHRTSLPWPERFTPVFGGGLVGCVLFVRNLNLAVKRLKAKEKRLPSGKRRATFG